MASINFNAAEVEPAVASTPIPAGTYTAMVVDSEIKPTQSGGQMAVFTLQVLEGQYANRRVWARINVRNPSAQAEQIGQAQLSALCRAVGVMNLTDTAQLHEKPLRVRVTVRAADGKYAESNEVKGFEAIDTAAPKPAPAPVAPNRTAASVPGARPWAR